MEKRNIVKCHASGIRAVKDAMDVLSGNWKLPILTSLYEGTKRFKQISREVEGISDKMLSKELKELEMNQLVKRTVLDTFPPKVEYELTEHAATLEKLLDAMRDWGLLHRQKIVGK
ncbi:MAG TPA: transcriptional regulator [Muricauda sp.]|uniref:Helix-turn-helix transcriptional regulator n=1 Tax=Flagellimonas aurea TaxID=2915619 RepID=A0ABS3G3F6_9FLAO|nr:helix-turn-helix domain-containing protein [Allomuricauda aurea]MAT57932.1 transcriptional regulator [Ignavibacteriota bacterium]MBC74364.1 transcriptional regulator [Allomuricauda sp.]MBO0353905.1 helix-turn-helix transcriptional regulator [Allomuricauda aurea]HBU79988.1 transcriptional regulator [Allomuricauda sp.]|tara:strand:+ start:6240 stop:6587 length:348 start_codon:yes stop_codon:yes gene_type:complete